MVEAVDFFEIDALDLGVGLFADEDLAGERTEFAARMVGDDSGGRLADFAVREDDGGRDEVWRAFAFGSDARLVLWIRWGGEVGEFVEFVSGGVALEGTGFEPFERRGAVPDALVVGVEAVAGGIESDAAGGADAGAGGEHFAVGGDADAPATPVGIGVVGAGEAKGDPDVAVAIGGAAKGVFVVVAADAPVAADGLEEVGSAIAIGVLDAGELGALGEKEGVVFPVHAEWLVQVGSEFVPGDFGEVVFVSALADPDVAATGGDGDFFVGHEGDGANLHDFTFGKRDFFAKVFAVCK